jgi:hypothetical protein
MNDKMIKNIKNNLKSITTDTSKLNVPSISGKTVIINKGDIYKKKIGASNILFIGGCRSFAYSILFEEICRYVPYFIHAQFGFGAIAVHIIDLLKREKTDNLKCVIEGADYIVCEQIRNYSFLNSSEKCEHNIFNSFKIKDNCKIIQIPNLELRYYSKDLNYNNQDDFKNIEIVNSIKQTNLKKIIEHCETYDFYNLAEYIKKNINEIRLFSTFNHPYNCLILELFKELIEKLFEQKLKEPILNILKQVRIFDDDGNGTKIEEIDYQLGLSREII